MSSALVAIEPHWRVLLPALLFLAAAPGLNPALPLLGALGGLLLGFACAVTKARALAPGGRGPLFWLFAVLHFPNLLLLPALAGVLVGFILEAPLGHSPDLLLLGGALAFAIAFGQVLHLTRRLRHAGLRAVLPLLLAGLATAGLLYACVHPEWLGASIDRAWLGVAALCAALAGFFFSFISGAEQTEGDCALVAIFLGAGLWLLLPPTLRIVAVVLPLALYAAYTLFLQKQLAALKWTLRGLSRQRIGRTASALSAYRQALAAAPGYRPAEEGMWDIHRNLELEELLQNKELLQLLNFDLCLDRAKRLLLAAGRPTPRALDDARKLLNLVEEHRPQRRPEAAYWRAVAQVHAGQLDDAAVLLGSLLDEKQHPPSEAPYRDPILAQAWHLALVGHPGLAQRIGQPLLADGRRLDAIAAVEKALALDPSDALALALKPMLYAEVTLAEYEREAGRDPLRAALHFDHGYCYDLGKPLLDDPARWRRGMELWQMAARGKPDRAPALLRYVAEAAGRQGDAAAADQARQAALMVGRKVGPAGLTAQARGDYFAVLKEAADAAYAAGDDDAALDAYRLYAEGDESGAETLRRIAELHEKRGDVAEALIANARCLIYDGRHPLHLKRRDQYYISLTPELLRGGGERLLSAFDAGYCLKQARALLDHPRAGPEQVDWALHLLELAQVTEPENLSLLLLLGRARQKRGEPHLAQALFERVYAAGKAGGKAAAPAGEAEEDWLLACRLLGDIYLDEGFPERALPCYAEYRQSAGSGAATIYKMGLAYERLGDVGRAAKCYENAAFYNNPLADEARQALRRVQAAAGQTHLGPEPRPSGSAGR